MNLDIPHLLQQLKAVILQENKSLRSGDLRALGQTLALKQTLLTELDAQLFSAPQEPRSSRIGREMEKITYMLKDNERLMKSSINSVRFAHKQISALRTKQSKVGAYGRNGQTLHIPENKQTQFRMV